MGHQRSRPLREAAPPPAYLSAEQLAQQTPWSVDAIEKMIQRGELRLVDLVARVPPGGTARLRQRAAQVDFTSTSPGARRSSTSLKPTRLLNFSSLAAGVLTLHVAPTLRGATD
jgi:hypothetical protein